MKRRRPDLTHCFKTDFMHNSSLNDDRTMTKVFIIRLGGPDPRRERLASRLPILGPLVSGLARDSNARRNPRSRGYMERAAADAFPEFDGRAMVMLEDRSAAMRDWSACDEIVLLWPDGNG